MQDLMQGISKSYKNFSSGQKKIVDLFIEEPIFLAFSSALEVGKRVKVSESTVIRWTQKLGYKGYAEFQQVIQRKLAEERLIQNGNPAVLSPPANQSFLENLLDADIASIVALKKTMDEEKLLQAVDSISQARRVYVTSNFFDYGLAYSFTTWVNLTLGHAELLIHSNPDYFRQLSKLGPEDTVVAFIFPRYTSAALDTLAAAKKRGAKVIVVTDTPESPAHEYGDIALEVAVSSNLNIDSYTAVHALLTSIMRFVYVKDHEKVKGNIERVELVYKEKNIFQ